MQVDKSSVIPIYHQLKKLIQASIDNGDYPEGTCLPSEREFCLKYAISRMTVRQAISELVNEGLLRRERGKGTFVAKPKLNQRLSVLSSFTEDMAMKNMIPGAQLLSFNIIKAVGLIRENLYLSDNDDVYEIKRLRLADNEPMAIETSHIPVRILPNLKQNQIQQGSLYAFLKKNGIIISHGQQNIEASLASQQEAEQLHIRRNAPVLLIARTVYDEHGTPIEYVRSVYRGDRYRFTIQLNARKD